MNSAECANCLVHGWKQPDDSTELVKCENCEKIQYCSKECVTEHWRKIHKKDCEYFKDPAKNEPWQHKEQDCIICLQTVQVGESELAQADNPNYECIFKHEFPELLVHPHPFPVTGQPGDIMEKGVIVLWQLVRKFQLIHPQVALTCREEFLNVKGALERERIEIWRTRKIYPQPQARFYEDRLSQDFIGLDAQMIWMEAPGDPFEMWETIMLIEKMVFYLKQINALKFLKDPLTNLPDDIKNLMSEGMDNSNKYLNIADNVLEALMTQVIPYKDVLKIIRDGSLEQECYFCSEEIDTMSGESLFLLTPLLPGKYICGNCEEEFSADDQCRFSEALAMMWAERKANVCDFCFQRTPVKQRGSDVPDIHRCRHCRTTMYCSKDCLYQDDEIHIKVCQKDKEGRKKKPGSSARRKVARKQIKILELKGRSDDIFCEVLEEFKLKNARKEKVN